MGLVQYANKVGGDVRIPPSLEHAYITIEGYLYGACFLASCLGISTVIKLELNFHHELDYFKPFWKFWSVKIMVSIAFLQKIALGFLPSFQLNLAYSALVCYELLGIALLHL